MIKNPYMNAGIRLSGFPLAFHGLMPCCEVFAYVSLGFFPGLYCSLVGVKSAKMKNLLIHRNVCLKFVAHFVEKNSSMPAGIPVICSPIIICFLSIF